MHIPTHILSGWVFANALPLGRRERLCCMVAASIADIDGLGFFVSEEMFWRFHHYAGHNVFFGFCVSIALATISTRKGLAFFAYFTCFHLHLLMDFYGSGIGWKIYYLWPLNSRGFYTIDAWPLSSWQNYVAFAALLLITVAIGFWKKRTPLELVAPSVEARIVLSLRERVRERADGAGADSKRQLSSRGGSPTKDLRSTVRNWLERL